MKGSVLSLTSTEEMISEAVNFGTIQVPPDGNPIVLLADRQTTGGYPKIGQVATVDLPYMAQLKPGDKIKFVEVSHEEA
ncbi:KipI antagonist, partial [Salmonella enterica]